MVSSRLLFKALIFVMFGLYRIKKKSVFYWFGVAEKSGIMIVFLIFSF